ncbi:aminoglycoside N(3)-acetyltransferase [Halobacillus amylolyticus]|uniref:Aminoglycoside N(3)-acetyltransferase n=1 Tax=Halobacillus amylolyticus TaxID=2932259 RepID=A0ABY4H8E4_9BACI|nr:AAC(3) family N-acetyltransferase [Halobacillus amylolyticus]UOR10723.1 AAC(3) family N-acetyltransferase [Halobacillus amylolyticus]
MSEQETINQTNKLNTIHTLIDDLNNLGVKKGDTLLVHASMKSLGWVSGGPQAVLEALMETVTEEGTIIFQTHSPTLSDPIEWENPPVPIEWHETIRRTMPAFDIKKTPVTFLGILSELFRSYPNVHRSDHPAFSISAWGKNAEEFTSDHSLAFSLNDDSPLGKSYEAEAQILLLGVNYDSNTSFHLSEYRSKTCKVVTRGAPLLVNGERQWATYKDIEMNEERFNAIGKDYEASYHVIKGYVGQAQCRLFSMTESVDFATQWLKNK